jgi:hypothetical protein
MCDQGISDVAGSRAWTRKVQNSEEDGESTRLHANDLDCESMQHVNLVMAWWLPGVTIG